MALVDVLATCLACLCSHWLLCLLETVWIEQVVVFLVRDMARLTRFKQGSNPISYRHPMAAGVV